MNPLSDIPIALIPREEELDISPQPPSSQVLALLQELRTMLDTLITTGKSNSIDIRSLPLMPGDYDAIKHILGAGEVTATVSAMGPTHIRETQIPGIWWVMHCNVKEEVLAEIIEVTSMPKILQIPHVELQHAGEWLMERIGKLTERSSAKPDA